MPISLILQEPAVGVAWIAAILVALAIHECSHAFIATQLGDTTARAEGRLTLNPVAHVDLLGFLMLLFVGFGWGKPVPFDPWQLKYRRWGPALVAFAGPVSNFVGLVASGFALSAFHRFTTLPVNNLLILFLSFAFQINLVLMLFNLIPIPPLDGSKVLLSALAHPKYDHVRFLLVTRGPMMLLGLIIIDGFLGGAILGRVFTATLRWAAGWF